MKWELDNPTKSLLLAITSLIFLFLSNQHVSSVLLSSMLFCAAIFFLFGIYLDYLRFNKNCDSLFREYKINLSVLSQPINKLLLNRNFKKYDLFENNNKDLNQFFWYHLTNLGNSLYVQPCDEIKTIYRIGVEISSCERGFPNFFGQILISFVLREDPVKLRKLKAHSIVSVNDLGLYLIRDSFWNSRNDNPDFEAIRKYFLTTYGIDEEIHNPSRSKRPILLFYNHHTKGVVVLDSYNASPNRAGAKLMNYSRFYKTKEVYAFQSNFSTHAQTDLPCCAFSLLTLNENLKISVKSIRKIQIFGIEISLDEMEPYQIELMNYEREVLYWQHCKETGVITGAQNFEA